MDILKFLREKNIEYRDFGSNVKSGNVNIKCPFCKNDPSFHMGVELSTGRYGCWRNQTHRGKRIENLVRKLIGCNMEEAKHLIGITTLLEKEDSIAKLMSSLDTAERNDVDDTETNNNNRPTELKLPKEFYHIISNKKHRTSIAYNYLKSRGFDNVADMVKTYGLRFSLYGEWKDRIIFPIYVDNKLVTWTSRTIHRLATPPFYKDLSIADSVMETKRLVYNYDDLIDTGGRKLYITEGVFDALKIDWSCKNSGIRATCLFTKTMTDEQREFITSLSKRYDKTVILLDNDATAQAFIIQSALYPFVKAEIGMVPVRYKDPGEIQSAIIRRIL